MDFFKNIPLVILIITGADAIFLTNQQNGMSFSDFNIVTNKFIRIDKQVVSFKEVFWSKLSNFDTETKIRLRNDMHINTISSSNLQRRSHSSNIDNYSDNTDEYSDNINEFSNIYFDISSNDIEAINGLYGISSHLYYLDLSQNRIQNITSQSFNYLQELNELDLSHNEINFIDSSSFFSCNSLKILDLANNNIQILPQIPISLQYLDLSYNNITEITKYRFDLLENLELLNISNNHITSLTSGLFSSLVRLHTLRLDQNNISHIEHGTFIGLSKLQLLQLSENKLFEFHYGQLSGLSNLNILNISFNLLENANEDKLFSLINLNTIYLDGNPIRHINVSLMTKHLKQLKYISITDMSWHCDDLKHTIIEFIHFGVHVIEPHNYCNETNIMGIKCNDDAKSFPKSQTDTTVHVHQNNFSTSRTVDDPVTTVTLHREITIKHIQPTEKNINTKPKNGNMLELDGNNAKSFSELQTETLVHVHQNNFSTSRTLEDPVTTVSLRQEVTMKHIGSLEQNINEKIQNAAVSRLDDREETVIEMMQSIKNLQVVVIILIVIICIVTLALVYKRILSNKYVKYMKPSIRSDTISEIDTSSV